MNQLNEPVKISIEESQKHLREALSFAAKAEDPNINLAISQILLATEHVLKYYERSRNPFDEMIRRHFEGG